MKNNKLNTKKVIAALVAAGVLSTGSAVFAEYIPGKTPNPNLDYMTTSLDPSDPAVTIPEDINSEVSYNGTSIIAQLQVIDGHKMFPLRQVMEQLNYTVVWDEENQKIQCISGAVELGMHIGQDSYYFSKMMPVSLGAAPTLFEGSTTYIPVEFLTDIVGVDVYDGEEDFVTVVDPAEVTLKSVEKGENDNRTLVVNDPVRGEVIVRVFEDTNLKDGEKVLDIDSLAEGQKIMVGYGVAMTMSLPPQTTAISVRAIEADDKSDSDNEVVESVNFEGKIVIVEEGRIIIEENGLERALNINEDTVISHGADKRVYTIDDLTVGTQVKGTRDVIETRSIPPISNAFTVEIID